MPLECQQRLPEDQGGHATRSWASGQSLVPESGCQSSPEAAQARFKGREEPHDIRSKEIPPATGMPRLVFLAYQPPRHVSKGTVGRQLQQFAFSQCFGPGRRGIEEEVTASPHELDPPLAGILEGHLIHPFAGKTWFSLALEIWPGRFSGVSVFIHTHPHHFDVQDCQNANPLRDLLHPVHSSDIPWPEMPATMRAPGAASAQQLPSLLS